MLINPDQVLEVSSVVLEPAALFRGWEVQVEEAVLRGPVIDAVGHVVLPARGVPLSPDVQVDPCGNQVVEPVILGSDLVGQNS